MIQVLYDAINLVYEGEMKYYAICVIVGICSYGRKYMVEG